MKIPFNKPHLTQKEIEYIMQAYSAGELAGDGMFTKKCNAWIEEHTGTKKALLTHSCTAALEMMAILADLQPGDEIILPSYTFVSTANAFVLRGATPVFVDIRQDTMNIDEQKIEAAITSKTKAIVPVHYAGVGCDMDTILHLAQKHDLFVFEDAAQGMLSSQKGKALGTLGDLGALSFHQTKNIISGEGGALLINNEKFIERAEIIREKGTDRSKFFRGQVDKYTWVDVGSSYLPGEIIAAFLYAQLQHANEITEKRKKIWTIYHSELEKLEQRGLVRRPVIPSDCEMNGHMYYILTNDMQTRAKLIEYFKSNDILSVFHYIPLHSSPAGMKYGRTSGQLDVTNHVSDRLLRLPLFYDLTDNELEHIIKTLKNFYLANRTNQKKISAEPSTTSRAISKG